VRLSWSGFRAGGQHVPCSHVKLKPNLSLNLSLPNLSLNLDRIRYELARVRSIGWSWTNARRWDTGATTHDRVVSRRGTRKSNAGAIAVCEVHASINIAPTDFTTSNAVHLCNLQHPDRWRGVDTCRMAKKPDPPTSLICSIYKDRQQGRAAGRG
jgi:hypothetical protein